MRYIIVNKITGEMDNDCSICSIGFTATKADLDVIEIKQVDINHVVIEITDDEYDAISSSVQTLVLENNEFIEKLIFDFEVSTQFQRSYTKGIDPDKATKYLDDRGKIQIPIEINGIGGREIIAFDRKPESIIKKIGGV